MIDVLREFLQAVRGLRSNLRTLRTHHVNRADILDNVRVMVDEYFRHVRPILANKFLGDSLASVDTLLQDLLRFSQRRTTTAKYRETTSALQGALETFEIAGVAEVPGQPENRTNQFDRLEASILGTLDKLCPPAGACYKQALHDLRDSGRMSWRGTAAEIRETVREVLDKLAPDEAVQESPGFQLENGARGPTMKQKVRFILKSRRYSESARKPVEDAAGLIEERVGSLVRSVHDRSSSSVHVERNRQEVVSIKRFADAALAELLEVKD